MNGANDTYGDRLFTLTIFKVTGHHSYILQRKTSLAWQISDAKTKTKERFPVTQRPSQKMAARARLIHQGQTSFRPASVGARRPTQGHTAKENTLSSDRSRELRPRPTSMNTPS